jgi:hypothetical protein
MGYPKRGALVVGFSIERLACKHDPTTIHAANTRNGTQ